MEKQECKMNAFVILEHGAMGSSYISWVDFMDCDTRNPVTHRTKLIKGIF